MILFDPSIDRANRGPILVKYSLNLLAIFIAPVTTVPLSRKDDGKSFLDFFLFKISLRVSHVFLISFLYFRNSFA